jgi:hypothetical protein
LRLRSRTCLSRRPRCCSRRDRKAAMASSSRLLSVALKLERSHWNPYDKSGGQWLIALHPAARSSMVPGFLSHPPG